ncbi:MAG: lipocalin family protein [Rhodobacteraceae bacterium]|nr:lipocalin family protein [Paracoccaceae bacterium]
MQKFPISLVAVLALLACATVPDTGLRRAGAPISSSTAFDPARFAGQWWLVAAYGAEAGCGAVGENWVQTGPGRFEVTGQQCGPLGRGGFRTEASVVGPGRIRRGSATGDEVLWVLWVDADYRVAVIGAPDGRFGRVLSRTPAPRADLMQAARDVLRFNGYDPAALRAF